MSICRRSSPISARCVVAQRRELVVHDPGGGVGERVVAHEVLDQAAELLDRIGRRRGRLGDQREGPFVAGQRDLVEQLLLRPVVDVERRGAHARRRRDVAGGGAVESLGREGVHRRGQQAGPRVGLDALACCRHRHSSVDLSPLRVNHSKQALSHPATSGPSTTEGTRAGTRRQDGHRHRRQQRHRARHRRTAGRRGRAGLPHRPQARAARGGGGRPRRPGPRDRGRGQHRRPRPPGRGRRAGRSTRSAASTSWSTTPASTRSTVPWSSSTSTRPARSSR